MSNSLVLAAMLPGVLAIYRRHQPHCKYISRRLALAAVLLLVLFSQTPAANTIAVPDAAGDVGANQSLALDASGNPVVSYHDITNGDLKVLRCGNPTCTAGNTIATPDTGGNVGLYTSLVLDASGNPAVSYYDLTNENLKVLHCGNATCTSGNSIAIPDPVGGSLTTTSRALKLDSSGNPVVSYLGHKVGGEGELRVLRCGNPNCTAGNNIATPDSAGAVGFGSSLALDGAGNPVVGYQDNTNGNLKVLYCGNPACTAGNVIATPDSAGSVGGGISLALDSAGNTVVSYFDSTKGSMKVLRCGNPACTGRNIIIALDTSGNLASGSGTSLALDATGNPVVGYYDALTKDLKVLHCENQSCLVNNTIATPDSTGLVGSNSSLALDASGNPVVSYYDQTDTALKVLHCGNATCTSGNSIVSPDTDGTAGRATSLVLDASGNPVVSYEGNAGGANGQLKVLHCGNPTCTSGNSIAAPDPGVLIANTSMRLDAGGNPVVSYHDASDGDLRVLRCGNPTCTVGNTIATPDSAGNVGQYSSLALDAASNPVVSYHDFTNGRLKLLRCGNSTCTAGNSITIPDPGGLLIPAGMYTSLALDASGNPVVSYYTMNNAALSGVLKVLRCGNPTCTAGNTTATPDAAGNVGLYTSLVLDGAGNPVVSYYDATMSALKVLRCGSPTCITTVPFPTTGGFPVNTIAAADTGGIGGVYTSLALDAMGNPAVSYMDGFNTDLKVLRCASPTCTFGHTIATSDFMGLAGQYASLALDAIGNPVVSYHEATSADLKLLRCGNPTCTSDNVIATPDTGGLYTSLALDGIGNPVVSYYDATNGDLKVLRCGNATCTIGNTIATADSAGNVGQFTSLALDGAGNPVVSYYDVTNANLKVLHCGNATCTAGNSITSPDATGDVGAFTSLRLDGFGNPVVSYYDATNGDLKVLRCGNPTCTAGNAIATPDAGGDVGRFTSLALDGANAVVSYFDVTNSNLKVLRCGNAPCTAGNSIATPVATRDVGAFTSLVLDAIANPTVSYYEGSTGTLKLLRCGTATCVSPANSIIALDTIGPVAGLASLASLRLDASGMAVLAYYDATNGDLKVARCGTPSCLP